MNNKIDFILPWVDGSDPKWIAEKKKYENQIVISSDDYNPECRYRPNTEMLRYWFRGVERFAPWVNKIHFVTCGQKPDWLNINHPKLNIVNHEDYIPSQYLPTFNADTIEMNFHRIEELSEQYVYFNDDMFLLQPIEESFFFKNGMPVLSANLVYPGYLGYNNWGRKMYNDYCLVNQSFDIKKSIWENRSKWFNIKKLGLRPVKRNIMCYLANRTLPVTDYEHVANPHLKSSMQELWDRHGDIMDNMSKSKFRSDIQVGQWVLCAWNQAKGLFEPIRADKRGKLLAISPNAIDRIVSAIEKQQYPQVCLNDTSENTENEMCMKKICHAFNKILPDKSEFEI